MSSVGSRQVIHDTPKGTRSRKSGLATVAPGTAGQLVGSPDSGVAVELRTAGRLGRERARGTGKAKIEGRTSASLAMRAEHLNAQTKETTVESFVTPTRMDSKSRILKIDVCRLRVCAPTPQAAGFSSESRQY